MDNSYNYIYRLVDWEWLCTFPFPVKVAADTREFFRSLSGSEISDLPSCFPKIQFYETDDLEMVPEGAVGVDNHYFYALKDEKILYKTLAPGKSPYARMSFKNTGEICASFLQKERSELEFSSTILNLLNLEYLFLAHHGLLLHSCFIRYQGEAILFSAPSGTGKSTQGDLWVKYRGAEVINGDRSGIYKRDGRWRATGLPFAGSSGIYRNENAPLKAIVYLAQGPENHLSKLSKIQAFQLLYPQITVHHWEADFVNEITDLLLQLTNDIPVYYFSCTPDVSAVETLEKYLLLNQKL